MLWFGHHRGVGPSQWSGERNEWGNGVGVAIYAIKMLPVCMYQAGGLMLKKRLLALIIGLVVI